MWLELVFKGGAEYRGTFSSPTFCMEVDVFELKKCENKS